MRKFLPDLLWNLNSLLVLILLIVFDFSGYNNELKIVYFISIIISGLSFLYSFPHVYEMFQETINIKYKSVEISKDKFKLYYLTIGFLYIPYWKRILPNKQTIRYFGDMIDSEDILKYIENHKKIMSYNRKKLLKKPPKKFKKKIKYYD